MGPLECKRKWRREIKIEHWTFASLKSFHERLQLLDSHIRILKECCYLGPCRDFNLFCQRILYKHLLPIQLPCQRSDVGGSDWAGRLVVSSVKWFCARTFVHMELASNQRGCPKDQLELALQKKAQE
jgi:hypothetical protein